MVVEINAPALAMHIILPTITVATTIGMIAAGITLGVIISQQIAAFQNTNVVLQSSATIVLNRLIEPNELPLFYDAVQTMNVVLGNLKQVLPDKFGKRFVNLQFKTFSPTPNITSNNTKESTLEKMVIDQSSNIHSSSSSSAKTLPTTSSNTNYIKSVQSDENCRLLVSIVDLTNASGIYGQQLIEVTDCINAENNSIECVNKTKTIYNCSRDAESGTIMCNGSVVKVWLNCSNDIRFFTSSSPPSTSETTPHVNKDYSSECQSPENSIVQSSIITSKMLLYFVTKRNEPVLVEEIIAALTNLKPDITLFTICGTPSSQTSSFNSALSKVEPPIEVKIDVNVLASQESISSALEDSVNALAIAAAIAAGVLSSNTSTPLMTSVLPG